MRDALSDGRASDTARTSNLAKQKGRTKSPPFKIAGRSVLARYRDNAGNLGFFLFNSFWHINLRRLRDAGVQHVVFALRHFLSGSFLLNHLATSFEGGALFDH